ncbi:hypothetical protein GQ53DRAFT_794963 [Thozetella sp. PMI_491]|nr:hypothetical protein GQ53DRAFT_794963 [Thozetella sp. PMI_491]
MALWQPRDGKIDHIYIPCRGAVQEFLCHARENPCHPQLLDHLLPKYNERGAKLFESFDALWTIFTSAVADTATGRKYCIIDALDECDRESQDTLLRQFRQTFGHHSSNVSSDVRILITSRPYPEIHQYLGQFANKNLASFKESKRDIEIFINKKVADIKTRKGYTASVEQEVTRLLQDKAGGTFLWVGLACTELETVPSKRAVKMLQKLPKGLHALYEALLDTALQSEGAEENVIQDILSSVAIALRPLSLLELSAACRLHEDRNEEDRIQFTREEVESCRLMVIVQENKVLLLHQSVKDFLVGSSAAHFNEFEAHARLAHRCVDQLTRDFHSKEEPCNTTWDGFSTYSVHHWTDHAHMAQSAFKPAAGESLLSWTISILERIRITT